MNTTCMKHIEVRLKCGHLEMIGLWLFAIAFQDLLNHVCLLYLLSANAHGGHTEIAAPVQTLMAECRLLEPPLFNCWTFDFLTIPWETTRLDRCFDMFSVWWSWKPRAKLCKIKLESQVFTEVAFQNWRVTISSSTESTSSEIEEIDETGKRACWSAPQLISSRRRTSGACISMAKSKALQFPDWELVRLLKIRQSFWWNMSNWNPFNVQFDHSATKHHKLMHHTPWSLL